MTKEEAEVALGPKLEWKEYGTPVNQWESQYIGINDSSWYSIDAVPIDKHEPRYQAQMEHIFEEEKIDNAPKHYNSLAAAKAACERHYATGKWEY